MKNLAFLLTVLVGSMCVLQSCKKDNDPPYLMSDQTFVTQASSSNQLEIMSGELAQSKGVLDTVSRYGQHMVEVHSAAAAELKALATSNGLSDTETLVPVHENNYNLLNQYNGEQFDIKFAELMILSHQDTYNLFLQAAQPNGVPNAALREWAASKLPALEMHFEEAKDLYTTAVDSAAND